MYFSRLFRSRQCRRPVKSLTRTARGTARLRLEALDERVVPAFLEAVTYTPGTGPQAVVTGDFNDDAVLDLAVSNSGSETVGVLLGNGDGTFRTPIYSPAGNSADSVAVGDFNADGKLDLATAGFSNTVAPDAVVTVLYGDGDGTFPQSDTTVLSSFSLTSSTGVQCLLAGDFDGDGRDDLAAVTGTTWVSEEGYSSGSYTDVVGVVGGGTWTAQNDGMPYAAAVGDFDGDGTLDVATVTSSADGYFLNVALGNWGGQLVPSLLDIVGYPTGLIASDLNNDGKVDLAALSYSGSVCALLGTGTGAFVSPQSYATRPNQNALAAADFNGDGTVDLITPAVDVLLGTATGAFSQPVTAAVPSSVDVAVGDFNGDGRTDAACASGGVSVLINDGVWHGSPPPPPPVPSIAINDVTIGEGNTGTGTTTFTVRLSAASTRPVTVDYGTADGTATAGSDYQATSGTLTFAPGETSKTLAVLINGDRLVEPDESFAVNLTGATSATIADGRGIGTIHDDEPRVSISDVTKREGKVGRTTPFTFTVTLSAAYDQPVTMSFRTVDGTATTGDGDYVAATGTLTFAPGETTKTITIEVRGDSKKEGDETFFVDLFGNSSNSLFTNTRGIGTILNDD